MQPQRCSTRRYFLATIAVAARGAHMATRFLNDSFGTRTEKSCSSQAKIQARRVHRRRRWARLLLLAVAVSSVTVPSAGCSALRTATKKLTQHEQLDEFMVDYRNRAWSARAWLCRKDQFRNRHHLADFEAGFRAGYEDVAAGGSGCVPAVCPRAYWGWQYQSADGQSRMNAWFEGYPLGVQAAEEDGIGHWSHVATSFSAPPPCKDCPTGAVMAVPAVPPPAQPGSGGQPESRLVPELGEPEQLPVPFSESVAAPRVAPERLVGPTTSTN